MAAPLTFGPIYCEDAIALPSFPIEPVNTFSNAAIVFFGLLTLHIVIRRAPSSRDLLGLGLLLVANGIGSGLWHGTRAPWALAFDVLPGLIFLFALSFCWARRLFGARGASLLLLSFVAVFVLSGMLFRGGGALWVGIAPAVILVGILLIAQTWTRSRTAALFGMSALALSVTALVWRTIDSAACAHIPFGTHFLWHIFNSAGAFLGVVCLIRLQPAPRRDLDASAALSGRIGDVTR